MRKIIAAWLRNLAERLDPKPPVTPQDGGPRPNDPV